MIDDHFNVQYSDKQNTVYWGKEHTSTVHMHKSQEPFTVTSLLEIFNSNSELLAISLPLLLSKCKYQLVVVQYDTIFFFFKSIKIPKIIW